MDDRLEMLTKIRSCVRGHTKMTSTDNNKHVRFFLFLMDAFKAKHTFIFELD